MVILLGFLYAPADTSHSPSSKPRIALLGDSMTWIGGDSCQNETGWSHILKESGLAEAIDVYARSGATWTNTRTTRRNPGLYTELLHDDNVIYNQAVRLIERADTSDATPDLIILFAGANDAWFAPKRPGIFEADHRKHPFTIETEPSSVTSLSGSVSLVSEMLNRRFPEATLLFLAPLQMSKTDTETVHHVADIIDNTAKELGWMTLRADKETGITHDKESKTPKYTSDGVHTNPAGAKLLGQYILRYLQNYTTTQLHN